MSAPDGPPHRLTDGLEAWGVDVACTRLAGDASTRSYFRSRRAAESVVIMDCGSALPAGGEQAFPFARWLREYAALGIRVPQLLALDSPRGLVLLEDLGDDLLQTRVERVGAMACRAHYERAVEWGVRLGIEGTRRFRPDADDSDDPLVAARLGVEMDLFLVHASGVTLLEDGVALSPLRRAAQALDALTGDAGDASALAEARVLLHALCSDVHGSDRPMALCHRDYHARNLIVLPATAGGADEVAVIDFQDTRRGPRAYDLASLAFDPYVSLPTMLIDDLIEAWRPADASRDEWRDEVALAAGQRLLKAAGSYAWLGRACGRPEYLQWLQPALDRASTQLSDWPPRDRLWQLLAECGAFN